MLKVNERISINGIEISDDELNKLLDFVSKKAFLIKNKKSHPFAEWLKIECIANLSALQQHRQTIPRFLPQA